jgi:transposase-like protein
MVYLYRAVDSHGDTLDFMLSERRDEEAATAFFKQAINNNGFPDKVVMDKSGANYAGHMCCFNSRNRCLSGVKRFKSHHWFGYFFDKSMVLFDNIIQIFNLAYVD